ncbi:MAG: hypothetical protein AAFY19_04095 [Pseudomonadota bacterium]
MSQVWVVDEDRLPFVYAGEIQSCEKNVCKVLLADDIVVSVGFRDLKPTSFGRNGYLEMFYPPHDEYSQGSILKIEGNQVTFKFGAGGFTETLPWRNLRVRDPNTPLSPEDGGPNVIRMD